MAGIEWPDGKSFAFTVFDDTDWGTVDNLKPVYDHLLDCGLRTTKSVWVLAGTEEPEEIGGATCEEAGYRDWVLSLQAAGFEIGWHNATFHSSRRERTLEGLERFRALFGHYPRTMANHTTCRENIYWGEERLSGVNRSFYNLATLGRGAGRFRGHLADDPYFWGDLCASRIRYVRNFVFSDVNTLKACPAMPYSDPDRPHVRAFFASSGGKDLPPFLATISEDNQDLLEREGGCCIMYTHFAYGFANGGKLDTRFKALINRLSRKNGWFAPVSDVLGHIEKAKGIEVLTPSARARLERRWLWNKMRVGPN